MLLLAESIRASGMKDAGQACQYFLASLIVSPKHPETGVSTTDLLNLGGVELETGGLEGAVFTFLGALIELRR
jgi:hypothetical protein